MCTLFVCVFVCVIIIIIRSYYHRSAVVSLWISLLAYNNVPVIIPFVKILDHLDLCLVLFSLYGLLPKYLLFILTIRKSDVSIH